MKVAFVLFRYFTHGGLQQDCLRIARVAAGRGHQVRFFTMEWQGELPGAGIEVELLPVSGWSNHARAKDFERKFQALSPDRFDAVVLFNRMAGGDFYFAADSCLAAELPCRHSRFALRWNPRYRTFLAQERAVFSPESRTRIWYITSRQKEDFIRCYGTPEERFDLLPPGIDPVYRRSPEEIGRIRSRVRGDLGIASGERLLITVGANLPLKGADRAVRALASLPEPLRNRCRLVLAGGRGEAAFALARKLGVADRVRLLGMRGDVPELLPAADLMVHPARSEAGGNVIVEALASAVPPLVSGLCGFAEYAAKADPLLVLPEPFDQKKLDRRLAEALDRIEPLRAAALSCAERCDFYHRAEVAVNLLERRA